MQNYIIPRLMGLKKKNYDATIFPSWNVFQTDHITINFGLPIIYFTDLFNTEAHGQRN